MSKIKHMTKIGENRNPPILLSKCGSLDTNEQVNQVNHLGKFSKGVSVQSLARQAWKIAKRNAIVSPLLDYARAIDSPNQLEYVAALSCCTNLVQTENTYLKPKNHRCGSRLCNICNNIRTAKLIEQFLPKVDISKKWGLLVLTRSNTALEDADKETLSKAIDDYYHKIAIIKQRAKRKFKELDTIITFEIQGEGFKQRKENGSFYWASFHPHINVFGNVEVLQFIKDNWIELNEKDGYKLTEVNQRLNVLDESYCKKKNKTLPEMVRHSLMEIIKYTTKGLTNFKNGHSVNVRALDIIISSMKARRRVMASGVFFNKKVESVEVLPIDVLDLSKISYKDLVIKDTGPLVSLENYKGEHVVNVPQFIKTVNWIYRASIVNYVYVDEWGVEHLLLKHKEPPILLKVNACVGRVSYAKWKNQNLVLI